ncbi:hypothetical protein [Pseudovibrio sp. Tun.PSC04-5.I4]|uniref:hypothetical protein n=1 Tax=Pseudovibrio sp. Tun.PSC04-5.I4 TaxID=1798213 RepID=UPI000882CE69|nr:hypothetical protein [Pseudovibrio sp. Tun.PSC04-5.I4]SDQ98265.1 hypothetical protein SAMN04515695_2168 [Pseudovibrio sp. Tun.PSC04-5.I4]
MPVNKLNTEQQDWAKAVYQSLHWSFPDEDGSTNSARASAEQLQSANGTHAQRNGTAEPDLSDYVIVDSPPIERSAGYKPSPIHAVFEEIGLPETDNFRDRIQNYHDKKTAYKKDPTAAAYADPKASTWERRVKGTLGMSQDKADEMVRMQFTNDMKNESRSITKEIFETQSDDPRFTDFLKNAASGGPNKLTNAHKEMLVFLSQNLKTLGNALVANVNELYRQHAFGKAMSDTIDEARENAVTESEKKKLDEMEQEVVEYRMAVARQLGMALNTTNDVQSALSFGATVDSAAEELSYENGRAHNAVSGLAKLTEDMVRKHLAQSNSSRKTLSWVATQPWANLIDVSIDTSGEYFDIITKVRESSAEPDANGPQNDNTVNLAQTNLTREKLSNTPELIFNGLRSPEMKQALSTKPTGEPSSDDVPFIEKPTDMAMTWGETLARAQAGGHDISDQLPDYMSLKQVHYHDVKQGFFSKTDTVKTAWIVEQMDTSETVSEVNLLNNLPRSIAGDLGELAENMKDLKNDQATQTEDILSKKSHLENFLSTKGDGLLQNYGTAHDAISSLQDHAMKEVIAKMSGGSSIKKIKKWAAQQSWSAIFDVAITPKEDGSSGEYNVVIKEKNQGTTEEGTAVLNKPTGEAGADAGGVVDEEDQTYGEQFHGLKGALRALLNPTVHKQLVSKPTGDSANGLAIVEEPSKLARDWADLLKKSGGADANLPDYLELREVQYRIRSLLPWKKNKLQACWVLEFKPSAFKQAA